MKSFPIAVVLSVVHNRLLCNFTDYRACLNYMCHTDLPLWEVAAARIQAAKTISKQFPSIGGSPVPPDKTDMGNSNKYTRQIAKKLGYEDVKLSPLRAKYKVRTLSAAIK